MSAAAIGANHPDTLSTWGNLAAVIYDQGRFAEAAELYRDRLELVKVAFGAKHPRVGVGHSQLCTLYTAMARPEQAMAQCAAARVVLTAALAPGHVDLATLDSATANALSALGRDEEALEMQHKALQSWIAAQGMDHPHTARTRANLAMSLADLGRIPAAQTQMLAAEKAFVAALGPEHPMVARARSILAGLAFDAGDPAEALRLHEANRDFLRSAVGAQHPVFATAEYNRGLALAALKRPTEAETAIAAALRIREQALGEDAPAVASARKALASLRRKRPRSNRPSESAPRSKNAQSHDKR